MTNLEKYKLEANTESIHQVVKNAGHRITKFYSDALDPNEDLVLLGVLKGSFIFLADLIREIGIPNMVDFITVSSYKNEKESCGKVELIQKPQIDLTGRHVLIVDDIVDTGLTASSIKTYCEKQSAKDVKICALINKTVRRTVGVHVDFYCFEMNSFVVGYGLDDEGRCRGLKNIYSVIGE